MATLFNTIVNEHQACVNAILKNQDLQDQVQKTIETIVNCYRQKGKVLLCGNGGSAADAEHLAGELSGRFKLERDPLNAEALHVNGSALTAISNDYSYEEAFARILHAKGQEGDVIIAFSTSGTSKNIINTIKKAKSLKLKVISICGQYEQSMAPYSDIILSIPSTNTPRIQEVYMLLGHIICEEVERAIFLK